MITTTEMPDTVTPQSKVISALDAAEAKGCTRQAIYDALSRNALTEIKTGSMRLVLRDEKFDGYTPQYSDGDAGSRNSSPVPTTPD